MMIRGLSANISSWAHGQGEKLNAVSLLTLSGGGNIQYRGGAPALVFNQG
jgi:hypothetical protein